MLSAVRGCKPAGRTDCNLPAYVPNNGDPSANESRIVRRPVFSTKRTDGFLPACYTGCLPL